MLAVFILAFLHSTQIRSLITDVSGNKLLILSGQSSEQGGDILLQGGALTWQHFSNIISDPQVSRGRYLSKYLFTVYLYGSSWDFKACIATVI